MNGLLALFIIWRRKCYSSQHRTAKGEAAKTYPSQKKRQASWVLYWTLWGRIRPDIQKRMTESHSYNSAGIFSVSELKKLVGWKWTVDATICFVTWITLRFEFITMLFSALRTENFERFRDVGVEGLNFHYDHRDGRNNPIPMVSAEYKRVKNNKGDEEKQKIGICCTCINGKHQPITTLLHFLALISKIKLFLVGFDITESPLDLKKYFQGTPRLF